MSITVFVLVLFLRVGYGGGGVVIGEYPDMGACERDADSIRLKWGSSVKPICIERNSQILPLLK